MEKIGLMANGLELKVDRSKARSDYIGKVIFSGFYPDDDKVDLQSDSSIDR